MTLDRRRVMAMTAALVTAAWRPFTLHAQGTPPMYGLIGKMKATPGNRDALIALLLEGTAAMPGCLSYIVAKDSADADAIWITEAWDSADSHAASLKLPAVQQTIARARPMIAGFGERFETTPVGGWGLQK
jgi:quinol monooxygenase YgiN